MQLRFPNMCVCMRPHHLNVLLPTEQLRERIGKVLHHYWHQLCEEPTRGTEPTHTYTHTNIVVGKNSHILNTNTYMFFKLCISIIYPLTSPGHNE